MSESACRVTVHCRGTNTDLSLPATMPVAELIPSILDLLGGAEQARHRLSRVGCAALPSSTTLAQNGIRDGTVLVLTQQDAQPPASRHDDAAQVVAASLAPATTSLPIRSTPGALAAVAFAATGALVIARNAFIVRTQPAPTVLAAVAVAAAALTASTLSHNAFRGPTARLTLAIVAVTFAAVAGLLAVPGVPHAPHVLLAATATAAAAVLAIRVAHCGAITLTALALAATVIAVAALAAALTGARLYVVGSMTTLACLGLIEVAPRTAMLLSGLSPTRALREEELSARTRRADKRLTSLRAGFAAVAALSAAGSAFTAHRAIPLAALTGGILLLHVRTDARRAIVFSAIGIASITTTLAIAASAAPRYGPWFAALTAALAAAAMYVGFVAPALAPSPVARRGVDAVGCIALAAAVPLACWTCGAFSAIRDLNLQP
ncbi:type VII secretion integral membrane protein EccD [Mycobacterium vicinigordonae]|uniref:Type VII secretion integral membrane protein EccD n=1 Tax=Mycobacterium vicinigordonae TaxID=1719132 RepID=A0A7D6I6W4_9MYCO|nr:type VII secretion integral membrane protein EccD [Mycobacterium vicinigordonae]QLL08398.1 type VII secretion integral membrane protein EccD [Mycobacterium vicinigordonae]